MWRSRAWGVLLGALLSVAHGSQAILVLQSDFGTLDGAVASMKGVAVGVSSDIHIYDLTHDIEPFNIWQGAAAGADCRILACRNCLRVGR